MVFTVRKVSHLLKGHAKRFYVSFKKFCWFEVLAVTLAAFLVSFSVTRNIVFATLVFGDNPLIKSSSGPTIGEYVFSNWHRAAYGENYPWPLGYLFLYSFVNFAVLFGNFRVFNFLTYFSFPISFISFYMFSKKFCQSVGLRIIAATMYIINPVVISYFVAGGFIWTLVFLPLLISYFLDLLENPNKRNAIKAGVFASLTIWTFPTLLIIAIFSLLVILVSYLLTAQYKLNFLRCRVIPLSFFVLIIILCNSPFIFATYNCSPQYAYSSYDVLSDFQYTYREVTLPNLLRLSGNIGSPQVPLGYLDMRDAKNAIGYIIPAISLASVFWIKKSERKLRLNAMLASLIANCFFAIFLKYASFSEMSWIILIMPLLWTLRNPFKVQLMILISIIPLFVFSLEQLASTCLRFLKQKKIKRATLVFAVMLLAVLQVYIYNPFAFNGYMGIDKYAGNLQTLDADKTINNIIQDSLQWYTDGNYRGIIFPFDHKTELHVQFNNPLLYPGRLGLRSEVTDEIDNELKAGSEMANLLSLLSTKYVYVNYEWKETGFHIIQPDNLTRLVENFRKGNITEEYSGEYSKFIIETVLPRLYVSSYPIFYSNIETIKFINNSVFCWKPVFLNINYEGSEIDNLDNSHFVATNSYSLNAPFRGQFDLYVIIYSNKSETTIYYTLDDGEIYGRTVKVAAESLNYLTTLKLDSGFHRLKLATDVSTLSLDKDFTTEGSCKFEGDVIKINDGLMLTSKDYDIFDLDFQFNPIRYGTKTWHGPSVYFAYNGSSYFRLIFHKNGRLELSQKTPTGYYSGIIVKSANVIPGWNNLRVIKDKETLIVYLNGKHLMSFSNPSLNASGRIGLRSEESITYFKNVVIRTNIIAGIWLFPIESAKNTQVLSVEMNVDKYLLQFNQSEESLIAVCLGENYDSGWEARIDGEILKNHQKANLYANSWFTNISKGVHRVEIYYKNSAVYKSLLYVSVICLGILFIVAYLPMQMQDMMHIFRRNFNIIFHQHLRLGYIEKCRHIMWRLSHNYV